MLVTGGTSGLGLATARALARDGAEVVITGRDPARCEAAAAAAGAAGFFTADFAEPAQVAALAEEFKRRYRRLDVLINNAGAVYQRRRVTAHGLEATFAVNHLAPFVLTAGLLDLLIAGAPARVVNVASVAHAMERLDFNDLQLVRGYRPFRAYARSKLANVMFTYELARRLQGTQVTANAINPGLVKTRLGAKDGALVGAGWALVQLRYRRAVVSPEHAAGEVVRLATAPETQNITGAYFDGTRQVESSRTSRDPAACARLWAMSEQLVAHLTVPAGSSD